MADQLVAWFPQGIRCLVAFSGGVDSAVVAKAAWLALGDHAVAVTGVSASLASGELENAQQVAASIGIRHLALSTTEIENPNYIRNASDRCYHCKSELYSQIRSRLQLPSELRDSLLVNGTNADDLGDYRPGLNAANEFSVRSPLVELGFGKADVRAIAKHWNLSVWDKPASPCLSSRIAYGERVTPERLAKIDQAELFLRRISFPIVRVRYHGGDLGRIEVPVEDLPRLLEPSVREKVVSRLHDLGFKFVTIDLDGFRSGSLNALVEFRSLVELNGPS